MATSSLLFSPSGTSGLGLDPDFANKVDHLIEACRAHGFEFHISQGTRPPQKQAQYYCQWNRRSPSDVDTAAEKLASRGAPWLAALLRSYRDIPRSPNWLTNALPGAGWHQWGLAVDAYCYRNGTQVSDGDDPCYKFYAETATRLGLTAGYYFRHRDSGHVQGRPESGASAVFAWSYIDAEMQRRFGDKDMVALDRGAVLEALAANFNESLAPAAAAASPTRHYFKDDPTLQSAPVPPASVYKVPARTPGDIKGLAESYNRVGGLVDRLATTVDIDPFAVLAVWYVESSGRPFTQGKPVLRFENHKFFKFWGDVHATVFDAHFQFGGRAGIPGEGHNNHKFRKSATGAWVKVHTSQLREYEVLDFAASLSDRDTACMSASFGGPQIMGFNHSDCGYAHARDLADAFGASERWQVLGFYDFCQSQHIIDLIRAKKWGDFGQTYNGDGATYGPRLQEAYGRKADVMALPRQPGAT